MKCRRARKELSPYLDRSLAVKEKLELERHLKDCSSCAHLLWQLKRIHSLVQNIPPEKPEPLFYERLCHRLSQKEKAPGEGLFWVRWLWPLFPIPRLRKIAIAVAVLVAVCGSSFYLWRSLSAPRITLRAFEEEYLRSRQMIPLTDELILPISGERE
jgi:anti-sigma factor RsiW